MAKNMFKELLNRQLSDENQRLLIDLKLCEKRIEFLENYRKILNQFNRNCVCDQNKITVYLFRSLERQYKQIFRKQFKRQPKTKKCDKIVSEDNRRKKIKTGIQYKKKESIEEMTITDHQINGEIIPQKISIETNNVISLPSNENKVEVQSLISPTFVESAESTSCVLNVKTIPSNLEMLSEDDSDFTFPSFNDPIFSMNASYVEELAALVVPKVDENFQTNVSPKTFTNENIVPKSEQKTEKTSEQTLKSYNLMSERSNLKFMNLLENLKSGKLQSFNDPNNDMISVFLKSYDLIDGNKISRIVYKCNYSFCGFETNNQQYIERHTDRHKNSQSFRSTSMSFRTFSLLTKELKSGKLESFVDPDYDTVLVTLKKNENSFDEQNESQLIFKCLYRNCHFETYGKYYIRSHVLRHKKILTFSCRICGQIFHSKVSRVEHQITVHNNYKNPLFKCEFPDCEYKTTVRQSMEFHKMKHKSEKTFKCETIGCDLFFKSIYQMKNHMKRVHVLKTVICEWPGCEAKFKTKYELQHHIMSHTGHKITVGKIRDILKEGNFISTVDKNNKMFSVIRQQNIRESDGRIEIGQKLGYKCNYSECKFICITPHLISEHTLSHSMGKTFECDLCHKTYSLRNHLNNHKKLVHNINNKCPQLKCTLSECDYNTRNPYCFRQHQTTHQTDTPFKCNENGCEKCFKTKISLKQHINNCHMNVNLLACNWPGCKASFKSKSYLNYHIKCHSKPKQIFECQQCHKTFNFKANLTKHLKSQHIFE